MRLESEFTKRPEVDHVEIGEKISEVISKFRDVKDIEALMQRQPDGSHVFGTIKIKIYTDQEGELIVHDGPDVMRLYTFLQKHKDEEISKEISRVKQLISDKYNQMKMIWCLREYF